MVETTWAASAHAAGSPGIICKTNTTKNRTQHKQQPNLYLRTFYYPAQIFLSQISLPVIPSLEPGLLAEPLLPTRQW
jgi:hypothetical protein